MPLAVVLSVPLSPGDEDIGADRHAAAWLDRKHASWLLVVAGLPGHRHLEAELLQLANRRAYRLTKQRSRVDGDRTAGFCARMRPGRLAMRPGRFRRGSDNPANQAGHDDGRRRSERRALA